MKLLFVGGCKDGEWVAVPDYELEIRCIKQTQPILPGKLPTAPLDQERYVRRSFGKRGDIHIMALEGLTSEQVVQKLVDGYKPTKPNA